MHSVASVVKCDTVLCDNEASKHHSATSGCGSTATRPTSSRLATWNNCRDGSRTFDSHIFMQPLHMGATVSVAQIDQQMHLLDNHSQCKFDTQKWMTKTFSNQRLHWVGHLCTSVKKCFDLQRRNHSLVSQSCDRATHPFFVLVCMWPIMWTKVFTNDLLTTWTDNAVKCQSKTRLATRDQKRVSGSAESAHFGVSNKC